MKYQFLNVLLHFFKMKKVQNEFMERQVHLPCETTSTSSMETIELNSEDEFIML